MTELDLPLKMEENMRDTGGGLRAGMRRGREQEEIPVKKKETQEKGKILAKMIEEEGRGWIRAEMKGEDQEVGTEEKRGTDPEVMKGKEKITEEREDKKINYRD